MPTDLSPQEVVIEPSSDHVEVMFDRPLKKHAAIVHMEGRLSSVQRRAVNVLLAQAYDHLITRREHHISISALSLLIGFNSNNTEFLKDSLRTLQSTTVEFNLLNNAGKDRWVSSPVVGHIEIEEGVVTFQWVERMAALLFDPERYAQINLRVQKTIKGSYALSLYENCVRFKQAGKKASTGVWSVEKWRRLLGAEGASYAEYKEFKRAILTEAINEINKYSDIFITMETERDPKDKRRVIGLSFKVEDNPKYDRKQGTLTGGFMMDDNHEIKESDTFKALIKHGISELLAIQTIMQDPELATALIKDAEEKDRQGKIRVSTGAYIAGMLKKGVDPRPSDYDKDKETRVKEEKKRVVSEKNKAVYADLELTYFKITRSKKRQALTDIDLQVLIDEYREGEGGAVSSSYDSGWSQTKDKRVYRSAQDNIAFTIWLDKKLVPSIDQTAFKNWLKNDPYAQRQLRVG